MFSLALRPFQSVVWSLGKRQAWCALCVDASRTAGLIPRPLRNKLTWEWDWSCSASFRASCASRCMGMSTWEWVHENGCMRMGAWEWMHGNGYMGMGAWEWGKIFRISTQTVGKAHCTECTLKTRQPKWSQEHWYLFFLVPELRHLFVLCFSFCIAL